MTLGDGDLAVDLSGVQCAAPGDRGPSHPGGSFLRARSCDLIVRSSSPSACCILDLGGFRPHNRFQRRRQPGRSQQPSVRPQPLFEKVSIWMRRPALHDESDRASGECVPVRRIRSRAPSTVRLTNLLWSGPRTDHSRRWAHRLTGYRHGAGCVRLGDSSERTMQLQP